MGRHKDLNRYHTDVYFPASFGSMVLEFIETLGDDINLTDHAADEMYSDKRGMIPLPTRSEILNPSNKIIEFYERPDRLNRIQKAAFRIGHLNEAYDYTYVVARGGVVVTCWANDKGDHHRLTESRENYIQPPS